MEQLLKLAAAVGNILDEGIQKRREQEQKELQDNRVATAVEYQILGQAFDLSDDGAPTPQTQLILDLLKQDLPYSIPLCLRLQVHVQQETSVHRTAGVVSVEDKFTTPSKLGPHGWIGVAVPKSSLTNSTPVAHANESANAEEQETSWTQIYTHLAPLLKSTTPSNGVIKPQHAESQSFVEKSTDVLWLAAYIDQGATGQTGLWLYGNWEYAAPISIWPTVPDSKIPSQPPTPVSTATHNARRSLLFGVLQHIRTTIIPFLPDEPDEMWHELDRGGKYLTRPFNKNVFVLGSIAEIHWEYIRELEPTTAINGFWKYIFCDSMADLDNPDHGSLPAGLRYKVLEEPQLQNVLDNSSIPRTLATLKQSPNMGIWADDQPDMPIGWGFLGKDRSVSSVHVEPEYRGRGLAGQITKELLKMNAVSTRAFEGSWGTSGSTYRGKDSTGGVDKNTKSDKIWGHADVATLNMASQSAMAKAGGKIMWKDAWIRIDISRVELPGTD